MTSEGHYAGSQPAEATSGGPESEGFPPDSDGQRISGRASAPPPADGFPSSYGPPPQATPNGGSPFVVPAVPTFGQGPDAPRPATGTSYGSARVPTPEEGGTLPQRNPTPAPQTGESSALPQRGAASPYGSVTPGDPGAYGSAAPASPFGPAQNGGPSSAFGPPPGSEAAAPPAEPQSVWGPPPTAPPAADQDFIQRPGAPLPQRNANPGSTVDSLDGFDGFAAAASRGAAPEQAEPPTGRPPGVSAFGDQRIRVPGATLTGLSDAPAPPPAAPRPPAAPAAAPAPASAESGGFPLRGSGGGGTAFPTRRGDSGGFPLRNAPGDSPEPPQGVPGELPIRSQQAPFGPPTGFPEQPAAQGFNTFGGPEGSADEIPPHPYGRPEPFADPFGRGASAEGQPTEQSFGETERDGLPDPFGRGGKAGGQPQSPAYGSVPATPAFGSARPPAPFGQPDGAQEGEAPVYGSARPAGTYGQPSGDPATYGQPAAGSNAFGQPDSVTFGQPDSGTFGQPDSGTFGQPDSGAFGQPGDSSAFGQPGSPDNGASVYGSARPAGPYGQPEADSGPASPFGQPDGAQESGAPVYGAAGDPGAFGSVQPYGGGSDDARASSPTYGSARPVPPFESDQQDHSSPSDAASSPFGVVRDPGATYGAAQPFTPGDEQPADDQAIYRRPGQSEDNPNGYPQRVPGAALGALSSPVAPGSVPAPRDPAENPAAVGSARPVTASASVPTTSRTAPVDAAEIPSANAAPQARVYGRPAAAEPAEDESSSASPEPDSGAFGAGFGGGQPHSGAFHPDSGAFGASDDSSAQGVFGSPPFPAYPDDDEPRGAGIIPQSPARASARVSPTSGPGSAPTGMASAPALPGAAPEPAPPGSLYSDLPGPPPRPGEPYSELTTDIAGRDLQPYVPAPALPPMPPGLGGFDSPGQPGSNGFGNDGGVGGFPSPASRATVTPPTPEDTTSWPGVEADQGRFDSFKSEAKPAKPETPHVRMLPILVSVVLGAVVLLGIVFGIVYLVAGGKGGESLSVIQGECVKQEGEAAVKVACSDATAFQVVSIVDDRAKCADPAQPAVINKDADGNNQVLCLKKPA
ncbi:hypothetical protein [Actinoplanes solisilvae]|uniref:hypothetical protein n=1 Tax=Actinoplanes solisilvae TaxID=2486853 RepID=UPI000FD8AE52|nr:hypothetical protein [Actinoplanes solisilvae]